MKAIKKAENVIDENAKKGENELDQDVIVIEPGEGIELLAFSVADFLAERTAERFDRALDETELETVMQIIGRIECSSNEEAAKLIQMLFLAKGYVAEAEDLDLLWICSEHDEKTFDYFVYSLKKTDVFERLDMAVFLNDVREQIAFPSRSN